MTTQVYGVNKCERAIARIIDAILYTLTQIFYFLVCGYCWRRHHFSPPQQQQKNSRLSKRTKENKRNYECTAVWYLDLLTMSFFFLLIHTYMLAFTFLHHFTLAIGNFAERTFLRQWGCCCRCWWWSWRKYQHCTYCYHHHHKTMLMMMILRFFILYTTSLCFLPLSKNCLFNKTSLSIIITHTSKPSKLLRYHRHPP